MLTPREREVLSHVVSGKRNKQIAARLGTAEQTIKIHRVNLMKKLKAESLAELVKLAERMGIMSSPPDGLNDVLGHDYCREVIKIHT